MDLSRRRRKREAVGAVESWWHSIDLGDGVVTPGHKTQQRLKEEVDALRFPSLVGKTVLDIGAWDGFFSFEAERRGASRVVALDHYVWLINSAALTEHLAACARDDVPPRPFDDIEEIWHADAAPGRHGFDTAREILGSTVEPVVGDFMSMDLAELGEFDIVLFLGVLYHMRHPLLALERLRSVTREVAIIESEMLFLPGSEEIRVCQFFERNDHANDWSNWWCPNMAALTAMCRAAGFRAVEVTSGSPDALGAGDSTGSPQYYRGTVHAMP